MRGISHDCSARKAYPERPVCRARLASRAARAASACNSSRGEGSGEQVALRGVAARVRPGAPTPRGSRCPRRRRADSGGARGRSWSARSHPRARLSHMPVMNERSIFSSLAGSSREVGDRGVTGTEVVDRDPDAQRAAAPSARVDRPLGVGHRGALGDLHREAVRGHGVAAEQRADAPRQFGVEQVARGEVHRHRRGARRDRASAPAAPGHCRSRASRSARRAPSARSAG